LDSLEIQGVSEAQAALLRQELGLTEGQPVKNEVKFSDIQSAAIASGIALPLVKISAYQTDVNHVTLSLGFGPAFGARGGATGVVGGFAPAFAQAGVSTGVNNLTPVSKVEPVYPPLARQARVQGVVCYKLR